MLNMAFVQGGHGIARLPRALPQESNDRRSIWLTAKANVTGDNGSPTPQSHQFAI